MKKKSNGVSRKSADDLDIPPVTQASMRRGVMGKFYREVMAGSNLVRIAPDLNEWFPNEVAVNRALRELLAFRGALESIMESKVKRKRQSV